MNAIRFPEGLRLESLARYHRRSRFRCGESVVDDWLATKAWQQQTKHLSITKVLVDESQRMAGYFTLATGQVDFGDLPADLTRHLPRRLLPIAVLAWLGIAEDYQGQGLGDLLLAQALRDCWEAGRVFPFVAVVLDCVHESAKSFYSRWDFAELPGQPLKLFLSAKQLDAMMQGG